MMISFYGAPLFLKSNTSHLLTALCPSTDTSCFPSCSTATPQKLLYPWRAAPTNLKKRSSLHLLCSHITCSHTEDCSVATEVWWTSVQELVSTAKSGAGFQGLSVHTGTRLPKELSSSNCCKVRTNFSKYSALLCASMVAFIHEESRAIWPSSW